jgi:hypothetical protein
MAGFINQFHATRDEHIDFVKHVLDEYGVHAMVVDHPFRAEVVTIDNANKILSQPSVWRVIFTESPPVLSSATTGGQLLDKNEGNLVLNIGGIVGNCLEESSLSTMSASPTWKKINKLFKSRTRAGVIGTHAETGTSKFRHDRRLSPGAIALSEQGTELRQYAQMSVVYRVADKPVKQ